VDKSILSMLKPYHTGGGCFALIGKHPDGGFIVATDNEGLSLPTDDDWLLCYYSSHEAWENGEEPTIVETHELH